jgi:hypothetical protein
MSDPAKPDGQPNNVDDEPAKGLSLTLIYSFIAVALFAAIGIALLIVMPFYHRR